MSKRILVSASTFPSSDTDPIPAFVKDQIIAMKQVDPDLEFSVLAPHDARLQTKNFTKHEYYDEYRFHYLWPFSLEKLAGQGGIMPALKANPLYYLALPMLFLAEFVALCRVTRAVKPDYLYAHWFTPQGVPNAWVSMLTKTPFVFTTHAADVDVWHKVPLIGSFVVRWHAKKARAITAVSRRSLAKLERFFSTEEWKTLQPRTRILPMGISLQTPSPADTTDVLKQKYNLDNKKVIFFMGRLAEKKGVSYLLKAFSSLDDSESTVLVIAGDGPLKKQLQLEAETRNISSKTLFTGYLSGQEKQDYLQMADIVALPSIITKLGDAEGLPVVFMEALAAGKVCIATNESGADDIITDSESGFLIPQKDSQAIQNALQHTLQLSPEEQATIQANAKVVAQQFDWHVIARKHLEFFDEKLSS